MADGAFFVVGNFFLLVVVQGLKVVNGGIVLIGGVTEVDFLVVGEFGCTTPLSFVAEDVGSTLVVAIVTVVTLSSLLPSPMTTADPFISSMSLINELETTEDGDTENVDETPETEG